MSAAEPTDPVALPADAGLRITSTDVLTSGRNRRVRVVRLEGRWTSPGGTIWRGR
ncbi:hypothetical protein ACFQ2M_31495 [Kitasatospora saccharophila]|uniref:hypothetical protein n=1 Tax=Kitasatospora saccharophila TaxID=407973 RepID=UPI0036419485